MTYRYEDLGDVDFQRLVQSLITSPGDRTSRAMPVGQADGGRDATKGNVVFQVKYSDQGSRLRNSDRWLLRALDLEEENVRRLATSGYREYILATNVGGTGVFQKGTIDKVDRELEIRSQAWGIRILVWWRNDIDARFRSSSASLKLAFQRALLPDEALALTLLSRRRTDSETDSALRAYIADQYDYDNQVRFEQADLNGPTVDQLFVDVPISPAINASAAIELVQAMLKFESKGRRQKNSVDSFDLEGASVGGSQLLLHPEWEGNAAIVGGPGRGKSTLLQYVCQYHRAKQLGYAVYDELQQHAGPTTNLARIPFRIDLRRYAEWEGRLVHQSRKAKSAVGDASAARTGRNTALELYIAHHVATHCGGQRFGISNLIRVLTDRPVLIALDGLDEVADLDQRARVAQEVASAASRLHSNSIDLVMLITTRPGATGLPQDLRSRFPVLQMLPLTDNLRLKYLHRWAETAGLDQERTDELRETFIRRSRLVHVSELSSNPMQLAILLHLLQRRGILPEQRTRLYSDYVQVFLDREAPKDPVVREHRNLIEDVHGFLGWYLQSTAEEQASAGSLSLTDLRKILGDYLKDRGIKPKLIEELFSAVTARVICLVQREIGFFEFEVQPLREYFAARHVFENAPNHGVKNTKDDCFAALLPRPYWSNVMRFYAGHFTKGEVRAIPSHLRSISRNKGLEQLPLARSVAMQLLEDQVFLNQSASVLEELVGIAFGDVGASLAIRGLISENGHVRLGIGSGRDQLAELCSFRLRAESDRAVARDLARLYMAHSDISSIRNWWIANEEHLVNQGTWLEVGYHLGIPFVSADIDRLRGAATDRSLSVTECVAVLGASINDGLLEICLREMSQGHSGSAKGSVRGMAVDQRVTIWKLWEAFDLNTIIDSELVVGLDADQMDWNDSRWDRVLSQDLAYEDIVFRILRFIKQKPWRTRAGGLYRVFGDCWAARLVVLGVAADELPVTSQRLTIREVDGPDSLIKWTFSLHENREDPTWWSAQFDAAANDLDSRTVLIAILLHGSSSAVVSLMPIVTQLVMAMPALSLRSLIEAVRSQASALRTRSLDLRDLLRVGSLELSPQLAVLLYPLAWDLTRVELQKLIARGLKEIVRFDESFAVFALEALKDYEAKVDFDTLEGTGRWPDFVGRVGVIQIARPTVAQARAAISRPVEWPDQSLSLAIERLGEGLSRLTPLATVAAADKWCIVP